MARLPRDHWQQVIERLDPDTDYEQIARIAADHEFPWDLYQALRIALFRTYAVPSIGGLLHDTGAFEDDVQKRHDDTAVLLHSISRHGLDSREGHTAIRRMNQMHGSYDIANADMVYVQSTFVVMPERWLREFGWRRRSRAEIDAGVRYWQRLGRLMGIKDSPATFEEFEDYLDRYEAEHFAYNEKSVAVARVTMALAAEPYPRFLRPAIDVGMRCLMDDHLLEAYHFARPPAIARALVRGALKTRARVLRHLPAREEPKAFSEFREIKAYKDGVDLDTVGTFPAGCPVPHRAPADE